MADVVMERQTYILVSDNTIPVYPSDTLYPNNGIYPASTQRIDTIVAGSMSISEILSESTIQFGQIFATKFECTVYDVDNINNKHITVIQYEGNNYNVVFTGIVQSCKLDRLGLDRQVVAYDYAYSQSFVNVADWYNSFWDTHSTATLKQIRDSLLTYCDVQYIDKQLVNDSIVLSKSVTLSSISFCSMLKMICELSACFPHFNRNGVLEFITLNSTGGYNIDNDQYEGDNSSFEEYTSDPFTGVQLYSSSGTIIDSYGTDVNPYSIVDNILIYDLDSTTYTTLAQNLFNAIEMLVYRPASVKMIVSDFQYKLGDYIVTTKGFFYVFKMDFSGSQLIEQTMRAEGKKSSDEVGVDIAVVETVLEEVVSDLDDEVNDLYETVDEQQEELDEYERQLEETKKYVDTGDGYIRSVIAETTGEDVWFIRGEITGGQTPEGQVIPTAQGAEEKYNITISYEDYGEPTAVLAEVTTSWSNQDYTIQDTVDHEPKASDVDNYGDYVYDHTTPDKNNTNYDKDKYFMSEKTGNIYQYKVITQTHGSTKITGKQKTKEPVFEMVLVKNGVVASTDYEWDIFPDGADPGDYYINLEDGKIYLLEGTAQTRLYWTYKYQCEKTKIVHDTMIEQTADHVLIEANARAGDDTLLSGRIRTCATSITATVTGGNKTTGMIIQLYNEDGTPLTPGTANITFTGLVGFEDLSGTGGTTFIDGGHITTNTLDVSTIKANKTMSIDGTSTSVISFTDPVEIPQISALHVKGIQNPAVTQTLNELILSANTQVGIWSSGNPVYTGGDCDILLGWGSTQSFQDTLTTTPSYTSPNSGGATWYADSKIHCYGPFYYPIFRFLQSSTNTANVRCRNTNYGASDSYQFAPISQSSQRWKHDIKPIQDEDLDPHKLYDLEVDQFVFNLDYLDKDDTRYNTPVPGFIAEKVAVTYPIACERDERTGQATDWNERFIIPPMLKLIQEQNERITALEKQIKQLQKED